MSKYAENNLRNGEKIVMKAKINPLAAIREILLCIIFVVAGILLKVLLFDKAGESVEALKTAGTVIMLVLIAIGVLILAVKIIYLCCLCLVVTNKRVIGKVGVVKRESLDYPIEKVDNVSLKSTFFGTILHYSTVVVLGANTDAAVKFNAIRNANEFKNTVTDAIEKHQEEARRAQAEEIAMAMSRNK